MSVGSSGPRERVLDPVERLSEILFGLIMVLSFTCSMSAASAGREEVREVVIGAIGCNLAWGVVDAIMYLLTIVLDRARGLSIARAVRASADAEHGRRLVADALPDELTHLFERDAIEGARKKLIALPELPARPRLTKQDWLGAIGVFLLVFLSTFPVVVPFMLFSPVLTAMRISNGVAITMLFVAGYLLARQSGLRPLRTGFSMVAIGVVLVAITMALGG